MWPDEMRCAATHVRPRCRGGMARGRLANADRPGVLSQGTYGAKCAAPLVLELLAQQASGDLLRTGPGRGAVPGAHRRDRGRGHELAHHGYTHTSPTTLTRDEERTELMKGLEVLRAFDPDVVGYRSPSWDFSVNTEALLLELGFRYSSNFMDDLKPYRRRPAV